MELSTNPAKALSIFLWLISIHSFIAGLLLIIMSPEILAIFGFDIVEKFFSTQAGVFHIVLSIAYLIAARNPVNSRQFIHYFIIVKFIATVFLISYFIFMNQIWIVLISGIGDFLMALILIYLNNKLKLRINAS